MAFIRSRACRGGKRSNDDESVADVDLVALGHAWSNNTGLLGGTVYEALDSPDRLIEIADWESAVDRFEQPGSGLLRELFMHDTKDPDSAYVLALFESEERARDREQDPRRGEGQAALQKLMAQALAGPPEFTGLTVVVEWATK